MTDSKRGEGFDALMQTSTLRVLAADARLDSMPAKFRWAYQWAADEIDRLRDAIRRLADQDATLSVVGGHVIVEIDGVTATAAITSGEEETMTDEKNTAEPSAASGGSASLSMTPEEFYSKYGDELVAFAEYYKYTFYFRATLADGRMLVVGYGGDADRIYRYRVKAGDSAKVRDLMPYTARVYDGDREVAVFLDY